MDLINLPVAPHLPTINKMVEVKDITIVSTPTGSGKTLMVPSWVAAKQNGRAFVTVPRVLLAKEAVGGVRKFLFPKTPSMVGYKTGKGDINPNAPIQYITEGSFANRVFQTLKTSDILFVDEVHEQGINTEEVLFLAAQHAKNGGKVVLMSATISVEKYVAYYENEGLTVGVFEMPVPKRCHDTEIIMSETPIADIVRMGGRTLIGVGGKADIENITRELREKGYKAPIFPLHSEIEEWEEVEALTYHGDCVWVATSVAMSGITFPFLDTVFVPCWGKRIEEGKLVDYLLSHAEQKQWEGRVGRTHDGVAIYDKATQEKFAETREANVTPEILRVDADDVVLSFASRGYDLEVVKLLNQPPIERIQKAKATLDKLGLMVDGKITSKGMFVNGNGEGILKGMFAHTGQMLGIEATARKIAALIEEGSPYRKGMYPFMRAVFQNCELSKISDHYLFLRTIEEDTKAHFTGQVGDDAIARQYVTENQIFAKGVSRLRKKFARVEKDFQDHAIVTPQILRELFKSQSPNAMFEHGYNSHIGRIVRGFGCVVEWKSEMYCSVSPLQIQKGRVVEMATQLQ